jgi:hypothetical protein
MPSVIGREEVRFDQRYLVHDNGGRPFVVTLQRPNVALIEVNRDSEYANPSRGWSIKVPYAAVFAGEKHGSFLFQRSDTPSKYVFVERFVIEFSLHGADTVEWVASVIGGSDVMYTIIQGKQSAYIVTDNMVLYKSGYVASRDDFSDHWTHLWKLGRPSGKTKILLDFEKERRRPKGSRRYPQERLRRSRKSRSPSRKSRSPRRKSRSPRRKSRSPRRKSRS